MFPGLLPADDADTVGKTETISYSNQSVRVVHEAFNCYYNSHYVDIVFIGEDDRHTNYDIVFPAKTGNYVQIGPKPEEDLLLITK